MNAPSTDDEIVMLRRAVVACRNIQKQVTDGKAEWFSWVPKHLGQLADRLAEADNEAQP